MPEEGYKVTDIKRILLGSSGAEFLAEVVIRTIIVYIIFLVIMMLLGKRMKGQLTVMELGVIITLGAIIAPSMQLPDRGIAHALFLLVCLLVFHALITKRSVKDRKLEQITNGRMSLLVKDGVIQYKELDNTRISKQQLFALIRSRKIFNLGKVERFYLEACGVFSLYQAKEDRPGLSVLPEIDKNANEVIHNIDHVLKACSRCGATNHIETKTCSNCGNKEWVNAVI